MDQSKPWTADEVKKLREMRAAGASPTRTSLALKKSVGLVKKKARDLGIAFLAVRIARQHQQDKERVARAKAGLPPNPDLPRRR